MLQFTTSNLTMELRNIENERKRRDHLILHNYLIRSRSTLKSLDVINTSMFSQSTNDLERLDSRWKRQIGESNQFWTLCSENVMKHNWLESECLEKALRNELKELEKENRENVNKEKPRMGKDILNKKCVDEKYERSEHKIQKSQESLVVKKKREVQNEEMKAKENASELESLEFMLNDLHKQKQIKENQEKITKAENKIIQLLLCLEKLNLLHNIPIQNLQIINKLLESRNKDKELIGKKNNLKKVTNQSNGKVFKVVKKVSVQEEDGTIWETREPNNKEITKIKGNTLLSTFSPQIESENDKNKKCESYKGIPKWEKSEAKFDLKEQQRKLSENNEKLRHVPIEQIKPIPNKNDSLLKKLDVKKSIEKEKLSETNKIKKSESSILLSSNKRKRNNQIESLSKKDLFAFEQKNETNLNKKTYHSKNGAKERSLDNIKRPSSSKNKNSGAPEKNVQRIDIKSIPKEYTAKVENNVKIKNKIDQFICPEELLVHLCK